MDLDGETMFNFILDLVSGMRFLHAHQPPLIHADLKSHNCLVDNLYRLKVADFGLATTKIDQVNAGTILWMAPEVLKGEPVSPASDVYSAAIVLFEIVSRREPYDVDTDMADLVKDVIKRKRRPAIPPTCPAEISVIIQECWTADADRRPTFKELDRRLASMDETLITQAQRRQSTAVRTTGSDRLLEEVFPKHVAEALKAGKKVEPQHYDSVTIFFSDIVGFTDISGSLPPEEVMDMLDRLYTRLDGLVDRYDLFKVETIGDAFMCVANLHKEQHDDHVKRIAQFSMDAIAAANETPISLTDDSLGNINIRVGFHTGPVVANVVGSKNPRYCLFGDTVNVSSRMESNSEKNRIHLSDTATKLLRKQAPELELESRGLTHIKGKGKMHTSFLVAHENRDNKARRRSSNHGPEVRFAMPINSTRASTARILGRSTPAPSNRGSDLQALDDSSSAFLEDHDHSAISML
eukprot:TRINITY_DN11901_c0_g6_i1.p1 TRINITY_DN11901_c0_g6~~TRINITY_DN11901_c0_g6_i1.p1  ORF type:complete len:479 (+),score=123.04 TRINITY_DN11901_c0_g6_i1:41-1438(+)